MKNNSLSTTNLAVLASITLSSPAFAVVTIDWVDVGNAGNSADVASRPYGAVAYEYKIGKNEVSISQYAEFLNATAKTDTYGLWNSNMSSDANISGITRSGSSGSYSYSVTGSGQRPITYVNWFDAARFTNWMHNGQPTGAQNNLSTEDGAYTLNGALGGVSVSRNMGATIWLPTENEWYKAAYYDPTKGGSGGYWLHANQSDTMTTNTIGAPGAANFYDGDYAITQNPSFSSSQNYLTNAGAYGADSESFFGTNDQAGNVWEWNDAIIGSSRGLRGGSWNNGTASLAASNRYNLGPTFEGSNVGFRVATVPEPSGHLLTIIAAYVCLTKRRRSAH